MGGEVCDKHDNLMARLFDDINAIKLQNAGIKGSIDSVSQEIRHIKETGDTLDTIVRGNEKAEGLKATVARLCNQSTLQWSLIVLIIGSIIGYFLKH